MRLLSHFLIASLACSSWITVVGQSKTSNEFYRPWKDSTKVLILDPYGPNKLRFDDLAREPRVAGVIHQASACFIRNGKRVLGKDTEYTNRRNEAKRRGYLWGSYHLGGPGNPREQADLYLSYANPADDEVIALDLEDTTPKYMSLPEAEVFINRIKERTGRYPLLYITHKVRTAIEQRYGTNSIFAKTPLWYARYKTNIKEYFPAHLWTTYLLWQFQSEINCCTTKPRRCPKNPSLKSCTMSSPVPGTQFDMDVNVFYGTANDLKSRWPFTFRETK